MCTKSRPVGPSLALGLAWVPNVPTASQPGVGTQRYHGPTLRVMGNWKSCELVTSYCELVYCSCSHVRPNDPRRARSHARPGTSPGPTGVIFGGIKFLVFAALRGHRHTIPRVPIRHMCTKSRPVRHDMFPVTKIHGKPHAKCAQNPGQAWAPTSRRLPSLAWVPTTSL